MRTSATTWTDAERTAARDLFERARGAIETIIMAHASTDPRGPAPADVCVAVIHPTHALFERTLATAGAGLFTVLGDGSIVVSTPREDAVRALEAIGENPRRHPVMAGATGRNVMPVAILRERTAMYAGMVLGAKPAAPTGPATESRRARRARERDQAKKEDHTKVYHYRHGDAPEPAGAADDDTGVEALQRAMPTIARIAEGLRASAAGHATTLSDACAVVVHPSCAWHDRARDGHDPRLVTTLDDGTLVIFTSRRGATASLTSVGMDVDRVGAFAGTEGPDTLPIVVIYGQGTLVTSIERRHDVDEN